MKETKAGTADATAAELAVAKPRTAAESKGIEPAKAESIGTEQTAAARIAVSESTATAQPQSEPLTIRRKYKDNMFRMLFKEKDNLLSLYNALNNTAYTDTAALEITTLENAIYMSYKNDISFIIDSELLLYEHQSTSNPNMPLRDLIYVSKLLQGRIRKKDIYKAELIKLPAPKFVVFYNGKDDCPERQILRLSDAYEKKSGEPELELKVAVYNINWGKNRELMEMCRTLKEYAQYVAKVREYSEEMAIEEAVEAVVDYCIKNGILRDFLLKNRAEAIEMCIYEYNEELHLKSMQEMGEKIGEERGEERGKKIGEEKAEARFATLLQFLAKEGRIDDKERAIIDQPYRHHLYHEYNLI